MLMILARLVRSESFWAVVKVRSPHTGPEVSYPRLVCSLGGVRDSQMHYLTGPETITRRRLASSRLNAGIRALLF